MKHLKKFNENWEFTEIKPHKIEPSYIKDEAKKLFNICKDDQELMSLVKNYVNQEGIDRIKPYLQDDPSNKFIAVFNKLREIFPNQKNLTNQEFVYRDGIFGGSGDSSYRLSIISRLIKMLADYSVDGGKKSFLRKLID